MLIDDISEIREEITVGLYAHKAWETNETDDTFAHAYTAYLWCGRLRRELQSGEGPSNLGCYL